MKSPIAILLTILALSACKKDEDETQVDVSSEPQLKFSLAFDETLPRLGNLGQEVGIVAGNAAQHPQFNSASLHYIELAEDSLTWLGSGAIVYEGAETSLVGNAAIDFDLAPKVGNGEQFVSLDLTTLPPGSYEWLRVSLSYQNYDIEYRLTAEPWINDQDYMGTVASFVGFNTYIDSHTIKDSTLVVNAYKLQGYWAFETAVEIGGQSFGQVTSGDGAAVTVVNPLAQTSPVPAGSCIVTGKLAEPLVITGEETEDVEVVLAFSVNNSFEWTEVEFDGKYEPGIGETIADMGLRGLHPYVAE